jgi:hypothetical protein
MAGHACGQSIAAGDHAMTTFLLAYHGGGMPETDEDQAREMGTWQAWYEQLGEAVVDVGNPIGQHTTVHPDGSTSDDGVADPVTGFTIVEASDMEAAIELARGCPILVSGGRIEVGETYEAM